MKLKPDWPYKLIPHFDFKRPFHYNSVVEHEHLKGESRMQYQGTFRIGLKENFRYNWFISNRRMIVTSAVVFALILLLNAFFGFIYQRVESFWAGILAYLPYALGGALLIYLFSLLFMYMRLRTLYKKKQLDPFDQKIIINREGVHGSSAKGDIDLPFKNIGMIRESRSDFVIFVTDTHAYVLPKNQMKNPDADSNTIRQILHKYMDPSKLRIKG